MALSLLATHQAAQNLLDCVCQGLDAIPTEVPGLDGCPCRTCVVPGTPAADGCDNPCVAPGPGQYGGQLTVNVVRVYATDYQSFPREVALRGVETVRDNRNCVPPVTAVEMQITLFRCTPIPTDQGCPPTCEQLEASALQLHVDMLAVERAVLCCYPDTDTTRIHGRRFVLGSSRVVGPQGGCTGFTQSVTVSLDDTVCCE